MSRIQCKEISHEYRHEVARLLKAKRESVCTGIGNLNLISFLLSAVEWI